MEIIYDQKEEAETNLADIRYGRCFLLKHKVYFKVGCENLRPADVNMFYAIEFPLGNLTSFPGDVICKPVKAKLVCNAPEPPYLPNG